MKQVMKKVLGICKRVASYLLMNVSYWFVFVVPFVLLLGVAVGFLRLLIKGSEQGSYNVLIATIAMSATLSALAMRYSSCSKEEEVQRLFLDVGARLFYVVMILILGLAACYCLHNIPDTSPPPWFLKACRVICFVTCASLFFAAIVDGFPAFEVMTHALFNISSPGHSIERRYKRYDNIAYPFNDPNTPQDVRKRYAQHCVLCIVLGISMFIYAWPNRKNESLTPQPASQDVSQTITQPASQPVSQPSLP
jgi:Na+-translocating ferredoxin:NAD+ oxidoreductase RnfA subunit